MGNSKKSTSSFPIVAIGASSGGLEAVAEFFKSLSDKSGMAYIYVQHLSANHKSYLTPILSNTTKMKVQEIDNMEHIMPNNVYIIPNDRGIKIIDGHIKLIPRAKKSTAVSIDILFSSLAQTHKNNIIGIILSGNAKDGSKGIIEIKKAGGITFAQDNTAHAPSMPKSAIETGMIDYVLSPKKMAIQLEKLYKSGKIIEPKTEKNKKSGEEKLSVSDDGFIRLILNTLYKEVNVDFNFYKMTTIKRRIQHRMLQTGIKNIKIYASKLINNKDEKQLLFKDLLIHVTDFFRDMETFKYLKNTFFPRILKEFPSGETLRIWIPACSTGEEAYTFAMLLTELQDKTGSKIPIQIFATDLSTEAIQKARLGLYTADSLKNIGQKRMDRFFLRTDGQYEIIKSIRQLCVFAPHNILSDPPFSKIDFISCRNLLIYFEEEAKQKALISMHFALKDMGHLMLGKSESTGISHSNYNQVHKKFKIYSKKKTIGSKILPSLISKASTKAIVHHPFKSSLKQGQLPSLTSFDQVVNNTLLLNYIPANVVINKDMQILKFGGSTSAYLTHPAGHASLNILKMIRPELVFALRSALRDVIKTNKIVRKSGIPIKSAKDIYILSLEVRPLLVEHGDTFFLIIFGKEKQEANEIGRAVGKKSMLQDREFKSQLEDLDRMSSEMASIIESQDKAYEELQLANEEITSASEEFQTLNEELETSKEEIEATNEELLTTNQELQMRNEQLAELQDFSNAVAETMHEPMLILDKHLRIKSANTAFYKTFLLTRNNTEGNLLFELDNNRWNLLTLRPLLEDIVQHDTNFQDVEVIHDFPQIGLKTMLLNAKKIIQKSQNEQLILLTFIDITERAKKRKSEKIELESIIAERTKSLMQSHAALEEKNRSLKKMNRELETFTFISNHHLQEPLRKIQAFSDTLNKDEYDRLSVQGKKFLGKVHATANRMQALIDDLLRYSDAGKMDGKKEMIDVHKLIVETVHTFKDSLKKSQGKINVNGECHLYLNETLFRLLMCHLISNAVKFSSIGKSSPRISISCDMIEARELSSDVPLQDSTYCRISVQDNGIGFDPRHKEKIFEVFQKLQGQTEFKGTGIGLANCKRIVENLNGFITADAKIDKGAQFNVYLPVS